MASANKRRIGEKTERWLCFDKNKLPTREEEARLRTNARECSTRAELQPSQPESKTTHEASRNPAGPDTHAHGTNFKTSRWKRHRLVVDGYSLAYVSMREYSVNLQPTLQRHLKREVNFLPPPSSLCFCLHLFVWWWYLVEKVGHKPITIEPWPDLLF